jgi:hypothetical protein
MMNTNNKRNNIPKGSRCGSTQVSEKPRGVFRSNPNTKREMILFLKTLFGLYSIIDHMTKQCTRWHLTPSKYILIYYYFNVLIQIINIKERQILSNKFGQNNILHDWYFILFIEIWLVQPFWYSIHGRTWGLEQFLLDLRHIIAVCF